MEYFIASFVFINAHQKNRYYILLALFLLAIFIVPLIKCIRTQTYWHTLIKYINHNTNTWIIKGSPHVVTMPPKILHYIMAMQRLHFFTDKTIIVYLYTMNKYLCKTQLSFACLPFDFCYIFNAANWNIRCTTTRYSLSCS